jgi:hypothetical protein
MFSVSFFCIYIYLLFCEIICDFILYAMELSLYNMYETVTLQPDNEIEEKFI